MNDPTRTHYEALLAPIYAWMVGDPYVAFERSASELAELGFLRAAPGARGLDLGAGLGLQTVPLARAGYRMTAVDSSPTLLAQLSAACPEATVVAGDLRDVAALVHGTYDVVVCMGDTLTHLSSLAEVERLIQSAFRMLARSGTVALTFRDYVSGVGAGARRFVLVRSDTDRILTCALDYGVDRVAVTDIVHQRTPEGWRLRTSEYPKLRLSREHVTDLLAANGATILQSATNSGRIEIVARRPP